MSDMNPEKATALLQSEPDEEQKLWWEHVNSFIRLANRLNKLDGGKNQALVANALIYAGTHYGVYEITEGGSLPGDIQAIAANKIYGGLIHLVNTNVDHLTPPDTVH